MERDRLSARWGELAVEVESGLADWRAAHPQATFREIEAALDERLNRLRARLLEEAALASRAAHLAGREADEREACPECGGQLAARGTREREVIVRGDQSVRLRRSYATCRTCGAGLFPPR